MSRLQERHAKLREESEAPKTEAEQAGTEKTGPPPPVPPSNPTPQLGLGPQHEEAIRAIVQDEIKKHVRPFAHSLGL